MSVILIDINNPEHRHLLEDIVFSAFEKCKEKGLIVIQEYREQEEKWTTEEVCRYLKVKPPAIYKYIREWHLPYHKGRPNTYLKSEVLAWEAKRKKNKPQKNSLKK